MEEGVGLPSPRHRRERLLPLQVNHRGTALLATVKAIDKALASTTEEETTRALEAARVPLSTRMVEMGLRLPDRKTRKGRKPKAEAAA